MKDYGKVSVITPVYNGENYINDFLEHINKQEYVNFEWIIIDDGSVDDTARIINFYIKNKHMDNVKLFIKNNGGVSSARNLGLKHASGDYIMFADIDDTPHSNFISTYVEKINTSGADIAIFSINLTNESDDEVGKQLYKTEKISKMNAIERLIGQLSYGYLFSTISKARLWNNQRLDEQLYFLEDEEILLRVLLQSKNVYYSSITCYDYVQRENSVVHNLNINDYKNAYQSALAMKRDLLKSNYPEAENLGNVRILGTLIPLIVLNWQNGNDTIAENLISEYLALYLGARIPLKKRVKRFMQKFLFRFRCKYLVLYIYRNVKF
ncbi:glycosyltransferase family A protein [Leuconostoc mesenteroides]|uniref:Glycosyltransferase related enzyme n=1 Tax=Leuconostoc mesenteroides subsp. mesenteroides (strain ATCC 8293 / DSM 20343 / BCRC 11652 / CCM 1803 / JCM 6124 / NCDO 523 / NBRC 100496 / NCIMB 8023 / NCTC 12954 / NRRL B-1118 / 37Y) TaxID=203120 RepID=Q03W98_LEUMM|nr:glycosyltransferase family A protein [Leuconostoc mesenteroides]ABJ62524.1 Glycosyltransferase related enzyme [Leuconostoc mesenteroides subsp. mesenteroides ATCC 8293]MCT3042242.1 glycosyltransferase family 2 protein [Leuconostoc mesenteroides]MDG9746530.1 glycosyltransferase family A protein [Leuconostoc mesenteroides]QQB30703.1 glycosyltransferase family 2 protein [Leuconostoc mesenteroides]STY37589.1 Hyaluronan synthase [Leuconostoc mesenteroides]